MKLVSFLVGMLMVTTALANHPTDPTPSCRIYDGVNTPREAKLAPSTPVSPTMDAAMGVGGSMTYGYLWHPLKKGKRTPVPNKEKNNQILQTGSHDLGFLCQVGKNILLFTI